MFCSVGRVAVTTSRALAGLLRDHRRRLGWTLRDVESRRRSLGRPIPFATLAKVEQGKVDPGLRRLHALLRIYDLPLGLAQDVLDLEEFAGEVPSDVSSTTLYEDAVRYWKAGDLRQGFAHLAELRVRTAKDDADRVLQQKAMLTISIVAGSLGRHRLARLMIDELLLAPPGPELLVPVLVQAASCWHWLGSGEAALGFLSRAEANARPGDHRHAAWIAHERASTLASMGRGLEAEVELKRGIAEYVAGGDTHGECRARGVQVRLLFDRGDLDGAGAAALEARERSRASGHQRIAVHRTIDVGRIRAAQGRFEEGIQALCEGLGEAVASQDKVAQFHAHYYLWKAYLGANDPARAEDALSAARYLEQFLDIAGPEAKEVRAAAPRGEGEPKTRRGRRSRAASDDAGSPVALLQNPGANH
jgi:hypothetical protein